jgi:hypothetical protein
MTDEFTRDASPEDLDRLMPSPEPLAQVVAPVLAEAVRHYGELPPVATLAHLISEVLAREYFGKKAS